MWFSSVIFYKLDGFNLSAEEIDEALTKKRLQPCPKSQPYCIGWSSPFGKDNPVLVHGSQGVYMIRQAIEERILPSAVVKETLDDKVKLIETNNERKVYAREKSNLRDEIMFDLLPKAFTKQKYLNALIDTNNNLLMIDTTNKNKAEEFCIFLRDSLGDLQWSLVETKHNPSKKMTGWLSNFKAPKNFLLGDDCELIDHEQDRGTIKYSQENLNNPNIVQQIKDQHKVKKLALTWDKKISFALNEDLSLGRIKFLDILQDQKDDIDIDTAEQMIDADFSIMALELPGLINGVLESLGGIDENAEPAGKIETEVA